MASAIFLINDKGQQLVGRDFRGDINIKQVVEAFMNRVRDEEEQHTLKPVFQIDGVSYIWLKYNALYVLSVSNINADASMILAFLHELLKVFHGYFGRVVEESIRDNFVTIHELLDEMIDFGYPQVSNTKLLQEFIKTEHHKMDIVKSRPPPELTKNTGRPAGIVYAKNECFIDVVEKVNLLVNSNGTLLSSTIEGSVRVKAFLSGMPDVRIGLNDRVHFGSSRRPDEDEEEFRRRKNQSIDLEDVTFHQCVSLRDFEKDKSISFVPPDGSFELMSYRINTRVKPLLWIEARVQQFAGSRIEITVKARAQFKPRSVAHNVRILIPVPEDAHSPKFRSSIGRVKYAPEGNCCVWTVAAFQGGKEYLMHAHFGVSRQISTQQEEEDSQSRPPIQVKFEIPYFSISGMQIKYLKISERSGYTALPWVRYITTSGDYSIRQ